MSLFKSMSFYLAIMGILVAIIFTQVSNKPPPPITYVQKPSISPFKHYIAASGIIESVDKNIEVSTTERGVISHIWVQVGDQVKKGAPLFQGDIRSLEAKLTVQEANSEVAKATLDKQQDKFDRLQAIDDPRAVSRDELQAMKQETEIMKAKLRVSLAEAKETQTEIDRLTVRAPIDGTILQQNIRVGEYVDPSKQAIIMGNTTHYQLRASIDEQNAGKFDQKNPAVAYPKNDTTLMIPLRFVRVEPFVIPKTSLTGSNQERVDTRVLEVIFSFDPPKEVPLFVGQQMDIFIKKTEPTVRDENN